jgi:hypothetical protein
MGSLTAEQLKHDYKNAHLRVLASKDNAEEQARAMIRRGTLGKLLHDYFGYTNLELEIMLLEFTEQLGGDTDDKL